VFEIRLNAALIALAGLLWLALYAHAPTLTAGKQEMAQLGQLEDAFNRDPNSISALVALSEAYLESAHPQLAVALVRSASPELLEEPAVTHQLASAYERSGRLLDALATADLALARCARVLGAAALLKEMPRYSCSERTFATLDTHKSALERMVHWGIVDPRVDPRAQRAYDLALRRARIAVGELSDSTPSN
jgi:predicted Zn-dependent protease